MHVDKSLGFVVEVEGAETVVVEGTHVLKANIASYYRAVSQLLVYKPVSLENTEVDFILNQLQETYESMGQRLGASLHNMSWQTERMLRFYLALICFTPDQLDEVWYSLEAFRTQGFHIHTVYAEKYLIRAYK